MGYPSHVVLGGGWAMVQVDYPHPQITHKFTIPSCPPSTELTYSHVALILILLNTGSPSIPPRFHNIQEITSKHHELSKTRKQGRGKKLCPKHKPIPQLSLLTYPVTFSSFRFVHRWIDSKILLEVPST